MKKLIFLIITTSLLSAPVSKKTFSGYGFLKKGELKGTSLGTNGKIGLTEKISKIAEFSETFIWDSIEYNGVMYLATGEKGKIYKYNLNSKKSPNLLAIFKEGTVYSINIFNSKLYAGVSPSGILYEIDLKTGEKKEVIKTNSKYIWQILTNEKYIYLACGMPGKIVRLDKNKIRKDFAENLDSHIQSITEKNNTLYFGTSPEGYILKSQSIDKSYLIYDSPFSEIKGLKWFNNKLYAICFNGKPENKPDDKEKPAQVIKETKPMLGGVVTINDKNLPEILFTFKSFAPMSLETYKDGLLIGTGHSGKLVNIDKFDNLSIKGEVDNGQITGFTKVNNKIYFITSNSGNLYSLENGLNLKGEYISIPYNANVPVNWGKFYFYNKAPNGTRVEYLVRGGNSATPDITWSKWQIIKNGEKPNLPVSSKIQWKVKLIAYDNKTSPEFQKCEFYYREVNFKPYISNIYILPAGFWFDKLATTPKNEFIPKLTKLYLKKFNTNLGVKTGYKKSTLSVFTSANDNNKDTLEYKLILKNKNGKEILLKDFDELSYFSFNAESIPEGNYSIIAIVRDKINNFPDFYQVEKESEQFVVDNSAPMFKNISKNGNTINFSVSDSLSHIEKVQISDDKGKTFVEVYPVDLINDSKIENYSFKTNSRNGILIYAYDDKGNFASSFAGM